MSETMKSDTSDQLRQAYQRHIDIRHITDNEPLDYPAFLESVIDYIRGMAEPLAYAIRENPPRDINDQTIVSVYMKRGGSDWLQGAPEIPMEIRYLRTLLYAIYDDFPEVRIPPYDPDAQRNDAQPDEGEPA